MGTSYVEFKGHGFWTRDPLVEALLGGLVVELACEVATHPWLSAALDHWTLHATAGFGGCVSPHLDWILAEDDRVALVRAASARCRDRITTDEPFQVTSTLFEERAARVLGRGWDEPPSALGGWLRRVHATFEALLDGRIVAPAEAALFVGADGDFYLNEPPRLVVHRWLLDADRLAANGALDSSGAMKNLRDAVATVATADWWDVRWEAVAPPALARMQLAFTRDSVAPLTLEASTDSRVVRLMSSLSARGWRWIPESLLGEPYDGIDSSARSGGVTWGGRLFGAS